MRSQVEVIEKMRTTRKAGQRIVYANGGFSLLGYVAERLNGEPFADLVRRRVLEPLGMMNSGFPLDPRGAGIATPYGNAVRMMGAGRRPVGSLKNWSGPAGALLTSSLELARFGQMVLNGGESGGRQVIAQPLLEQATSVQARNHPELDEGIGLGFWVSRYRGRALVGHTGGLAGVATRLDILPDDGAGIVVMTNGGDPFFVQRVAERMREMLLRLEPEAVPGSPAGMVAGTQGEWESFTRRVAGKYRMPDIAPPGLLRALAGLVARPRLSHVRDGILAMEGIGSEPGFLYPDGQVGRYRVAYPLANGLRAVIEEKASGTHLWTSIMHLFRPK
jgi:CubicO group peptidase (beta-lactamase class C family)